MAIFTYQNPKNAFLVSKILKSNTGEAHILLTKNQKLIFSK